MLEKTGNADFLASSLGTPSRRAILGHPNGGAAPNLPQLSPGQRKGLLTREVLD